jgi:hypothetical protein
VFCVVQLDRRVANTRLHCVYCMFAKTISYLPHQNTDSGVNVSSLRCFATKNIISGCELAHIFVLLCFKTIEKLTNKGKERDVN